MVQPRRKDAGKAESLAIVCHAIVDFLASQGLGEPQTLRFRQTISLLAADGRLGALRAARHELVQFLDDVPSGARAEFEQSLRARFGSDVLELRPAAKRLFESAVKRGSIATFAEYAAVQEQAERAIGEHMSPEYVETLNRMLSEFDSRRH